MTDGLMRLGDAVLPLIRSTDRELWRYSRANEQGDRMLNGVGLLESAASVPEGMPRYGIATPTAQEVYEVTHKALASAIRVIARADDSMGIIGTACTELIALHPKVAAEAGVPVLKLADWIYKFHFDDEVDYFLLDPVAYAPALGEQGLARLRLKIDSLRAELPASNPEEAATRFMHEEFIVEWFDKRFAVLDRDAEAIIRTHLRDGRVAAWYEDVAAAFEEIGYFDAAIDWAEKATMFGLGHQSQTAARRWELLLTEHQPGELPRAVRTVFDRWPNAGTAKRFVEIHGPSVINQVLADLEGNPRELVRFQLETMDDPVMAWESANRLELADGSLWSELAKAYFPIDPVAAIGVLLELVDSSLVEANTRRYGPAVRELVRIKKQALNTNQTEAIQLVDASITELRERYKRRPSLMARLDRAGLP